MTWIQKLWGKLLKTPAELFVFDKLSEAQGAPKGRPLKPDSDYISVVVKSIYIPFRRLQMTTFHGSVISELSLAHEQAGTAYFHVVTSPGVLRSADAANLANVIQIDLPLVDRVPFRGGNIEIQVGLFAEKSADLARPLIDVVSTIAGAAGVAFVSAAQPFTEPLKRAINIATGVPNAFTLLVGLYGSLPTETGYIAVVAAPQKDVNLASLRLHPNRNTLLKADGTDFTDASYMIISVEATPTKDWTKIPELLTANARLRDALAGKQQNNLREDSAEAFTQFRRTVLSSPDLLLDDAELIVNRAQQRMDKIVSGGVSKIASAETQGWPEDLAEI